MQLNSDIPQVAAGSTTKSINVWVCAGTVAALLLLALGICVGSNGFENIWELIVGAHRQGENALITQQIIVDIRLPRSIGAWAAGALLGLSGALAQGLFRNPLADPYLLGSASGASLGVVLALVGWGVGSGLLNGMGLIHQDATTIGVFSNQLWVRVGVTGAAFIGSVCAVLLTLLLAHGVGHTLRLLLAGVIVSVVLGAVTHWALIFAPQHLQTMQTFMLGSTVFITWMATWMMLAVWVLCLSLAWFFARVLDSLSLGDATALSLGIPIVPMRLALIAVLGLAIGTAVAQTGLIAFVGLAAPHLVKSWIKTLHAQLIILASLSGGLLLMAADILARWVIAPQELPVGILTAVLGGGYLLWLMHRGLMRKGVAA